MFKLFLLAGTSLVRKLSVCVRCYAQRKLAWSLTTCLFSLTSNHHKIAGEHLFYNIIISDTQRIYTYSQKIRIFSKTLDLEVFTRFERLKIFCLKKFKKVIKL